MKYKAVITVYSEFDPGEVELTDLAREADQGSAICTDFKVTQVTDKSLPEAAASFFNMED